MGRHLGELLSSLTSSVAQNITLAKVLAPRLQHPSDGVTLAFSCLCSDQKSRPTMQSVSKEFQALRDGSSPTISSNSSFQNLIMN